MCTDATDSDKSREQRYARSASRICLSCSLNSGSAKAYAFFMISRTASYASKSFRATLLCESFRTASTCFTRTAFASGGRVSDFSRSLARCAIKWFPVAPRLGRSLKRKRSPRRDAFGGPRSCRLRRQARGT